MGNHQELGAGPVVTTKFWNSYGKKRLYVRLDEAQIGYWDVGLGSAVAEDARSPQAAEHLAIIESMAQDWLASQGRKKPRGAERPDGAASETISVPTPIPPTQTAPAPSRPDLLASAPAQVQAVPTSPPGRGRDLSLNKAGSSAREMARAKFREAPLRNLFKRLIGRKTGEAWRWHQGVRGEEAVGHALDKAIVLRKGWFLLHGITRHARGTDVDHLLIGPSGVFSINAKFHEGKKVWVSEHAIGIGGKAQNYLHVARSEAKKVKELLYAAYPAPYQVTPVVVIAGSRSFKRGKRMPADVVVLHVDEIADWIAGLGEKIRPWEVERLYGVARWEQTWL